MPDRSRSFLLVPAGGAGEGMGHLVRCIHLSRLLGRRVSFLVAHMDARARDFLEGQMSGRDRGRGFGGKAAGRASGSPASNAPTLIERIPSSARWDVIVVDARRTTLEELDELSMHGLVTCLDEGGPARDFASYIVDTLPGLPGRAPANLDGPSFLILPRRTRNRAPNEIGRVLVSIGGEDRGRLGEKLAGLMVSSGSFRAEQITAVQGPLSASGHWPQGVNLVRGTGDLPRLLARHDVLITHFGMAAFEALACGVAAILFNPTPYHEALGRAAGFPMIGVGTPNMGALKTLLSDPAGLYSRVQRFNESLGKDRSGRLVAALRPLVRIGGAVCPACGHSGNRVVARFSDRTYRRCAECGTTGLESFTGRRKRYDAGYFSAEYKAQYGRTYLEDFEAIRSACRPRAAIVRSLLSPLRDGRNVTAYRDGRNVTAYRDGIVLDVGCAYGPFLSAAAEAGLPVFGLDISPGAVAYVKKTLGFPAIVASFETVPADRLPGTVAALTMWYVIEHFPDTRRILAKAASLLPAGGVLALSTPNATGVSARRSMRDFLRASPGDHFTVLSPQALRKILPRHGFSLRRVRVTGHHPERFPGLLGSAARRWPWAARLLRPVSVALRLGDTFEAYAVKETAQ